MDNNPGLPNNISTEEFPNNVFRRFIVNFYGLPICTLVTSISGVAGSWVERASAVQRYMGHILIVGLAVQCLPNNNTNGGNLIPPAATLQLCLGVSCLIFQICRRDRAVPQVLVDFLASPDFHFVGIRNSFHSQMLMASDPALRVHTVDLGRLAGFPTISFEEMVHMFLEGGYVHPSWIGTTDWNAAHLSRLQVQYACVQAFVPYQIGEILRRR